MAFTDQSISTPVLYADEATRSTFLVKVYQHLALAIVAFIGMEAALFATGLAKLLGDFVFSGGSFRWLMIMGGFMLVSSMASRSAHSLNKPAVQYGALFAMAAAYAFIFAPFLYYVFIIRESATTVWSAAIITVAGFAALTAVAMTTKKDLSFMRPMIMWGSIVAIGLIVAGAIFGFELGAIFSVAMIALSGASILYQTQQIVRKYPAWAYVGAAVGLFSSVMMMFWYVLRLLMSRD